MTDDHEELQRRITEERGGPSTRAFDAVLDDLDPRDRVASRHTGLRNGLAFIAAGGALLVWGVFAVLVALADRNGVVGIIGAAMVLGGPFALRSGLRRRHGQGPA